MARLSRASLQRILALLAIAATVASSFYSHVPASDDFVTLLISAGLIAIVSRFPILLREVELSLAHAIGISVLFAFGVAPAAWTMLFGVLGGELMWFLAPASPPSPARPSRVSDFFAHFDQQMVPLVVAGTLDGILASQFGMSSAAQNVVTLAIFILVFVVVYSALLALEVYRGPDTIAAFFRDHRNLMAVSLVQILPLALVISAGFQSLWLGTGSGMIIGLVLVTLAALLYNTSRALLSQDYELGESLKRLDQARRDLDLAAHQTTLLAAKEAVAARTAQTYSDRAQQFDILVQLNDTLRAFSGANLPYDTILRQIGEAVEAHLGQLGLLSSSGQSIQFVSSYGFSEERAASEQNAVASLDRGLYGRALRSGQPVRVANLSIDPDNSEQIPSMRSELCVPLLQGDRRLGVIRLLSRQANAFSADDEAFVVQAATLVALAVVNTHLKEQAQTSQKEHTLLFETGAMLAANLDVRAVQHTAAQKLAEALDADLCTLAEVDEAAGTFRLIEPHAPKSFSLRDYPSAARAIAERKSLVLQVNDTRADPKELGTMRAEGMSTLALIPMLADEQVTGLARIYSLEARQFTPSELGIVQTLANQAATALKNAQNFQRVTENRDRLAAILDSTREGVLVIDASGLISLVNPRVEELLRVPVQRLLNRHLTDLLNDNDLDIASKLGFKRDEIEELLLTLRAGLALSIPRAQYALSTPKPRYLERTGAPVLDQFARAIGWVIILRDMTEERELQQVRDTLANMIVHDLRSPLTAMLTGLSLMRDRMPREQLSPLIRQSLDVAIRSCNKMIGLVNTLLDLSRMESGELTLNRSEVRLDEVVDEAISDLTPLANEQGLVLISEVASTLPPVQADHDKLSRVLTNLLDNALKFSPPGGQVVVRAEVQANGSNASVLACSVLDNGPGIPDEYRDRIFDRFVQIHGRQGKRQGTGLGLTFCKMAVEAHGGRIWAENRAEGGSAFHFTLPVEQPGA